MKAVAKSLVVAFAVVVAHAGPLSAQSLSLRDAIVRNHFEYLPDGPGPFPTIVAIPGCSGLPLPDAAEEASHPDLAEDDRLFRAHYPKTADRLRHSGYAVLLIHVHGGEGLLTACQGEIPAARVAAYVAEATAWASELEFVDPDRLHVIGWSMGGRGVLAWMERPLPDPVLVRSAVAVYPACSRTQTLRASIPLLMLLGGADDIAIPETCEALVERTSTPSMIDVRNFPGARHGYDIEDAPSRVDIGGGMTIGFHREAAEETWRMILSFLSTR